MSRGSPGATPPSSASTHRAANTKAAWSDTAQTLASVKNSGLIHRALAIVRSANLAPADSEEVTPSGGIPNTELGGCNVHGLTNLLQWQPPQDSSTWVQAAIAYGLLSWYVIGPARSDRVAGRRSHSTVLLSRSRWR